MKDQIVILDDEMKNIGIMWSTKLVLGNDCPVGKHGIKIISSDTVEATSLL